MRYTMNLRIDDEELVAEVREAAEKLGMSMNALLLAVLKQHKGELLQVVVDAKVAEWKEVTA